MALSRRLVAGVLVAGGFLACGSSGAGSAGEDGGDDSTTLDAGGEASGGQDGASAADGSDGASQTGPLTCPGPGNYKNNGSACGAERWSIKTGQDTGAGAVSLSPQLTTIATLTALPAPGTLGNTRIAPTETTLWELKDVHLQLVRLESDSDYHLVVADAGHTMIVEIPYPGCLGSSPWKCLISRARATVDGSINATTGGVNPNVTASVMGVGFFDFQHGQTGVAPNAVELHAVLAICFGQGCDPRKQ